MKILIAGGSGFIGKTLVTHLNNEGYLVSLLSRQNKLITDYDECFTWQEMTTEKITQFDVVINLCGYGIGEKRWSDAIKEQIISSRIDSTERLIKLIADHDIWLINASAIGFYPFSEKVQDENYIVPATKNNTGFCQYVVNQWEALVNRARLRRKTIVRFGVVLGHGGVLDKLLKSAKLGLAAKLGCGRQVMSWVHVDDLCRAIIFVLQNKLTYEAINIVSPNTCQQLEFINALACTLRKPRWFWLPKIILQLMLGQMAKELLFSSHNIKPTRLCAAGFKFQHSKIEAALESLLRSSHSNGGKSIQNKAKAILLVNLGTPDSYQVKDVRKYLKEFLSDRRVIEASPWIWQPILRLIVLPFRAPKIAKLYQKIWFKEKNSSPLLYYTKTQAHKLSSSLENQMIVDFAMRYGNPSIKAKIEVLQKQGVTEITVLPLYPQYSATTTASVFDETFRMLQTMRYQPNIIGIAPYYQHPAYINALKQSVLDYLKNISFTPEVLLLSFHGLPVECIQKGDPYYYHCQRTYELVKAELNSIDLEIKMSFQSRFGPKEWLKPYTADVLTQLPKDNKKNVLIIAPGFAADCLETLEELDKAERERFMQAGGENYALIFCLNDSHAHINMFKTLVSG